ncbi:MULTISPECIES: hypothetical protein [Methylomicrobium]|uniref:hypothetical protein n=1 Tax=Methylomicrobium TaxID=39773 RepID=UPI0004DF0E77|nr:MULTISPECIES: hypothetical protein [Methylomicrobium]
MQDAYQPVLIEDLVENNFPKWMVMKSGLFTPLFEKDDCREAGGRLRREHAIESNAGAIAEGRRRFIEQILLDPLFSKGEVVF